VQFAHSAYYGATGSLLFLNKKTAKTTKTKKTFSLLWCNAASFPRNFEWYNSAVALTLEQFRFFSDSVALTLEQFRFYPGAILPFSLLWCNSAPLNLAQLSRSVQCGTTFLFG
jgi:hypothetical protein